MLKRTVTGVALIAVLVVVLLFLPAWCAGVLLSVMVALAAKELLSQYLYSKDVPDPELIIRPSGEQRTSNFLLWQSAYSEYVFMDVLWPDFGPDDLDKAIEEFHRRNRRFGGV